MSSSEGFVDDNENLMRTDAPERTILATVSGATRATIRETKRNETYRRRPLWEARSSEKSVTNDLINPKTFLNTSVDLISDHTL